jgi:ElaB/YqjD/DUF883 family membrane-anchored ribosome-binding protein
MNGRYVMAKKSYGPAEEALHAETAEAASRESAGEEPSLSDRLGETVGEAGRLLRESTADIDETVDRAMDHAQRSFGAIGRHVRDQPLASLAIAFLVGMAVIGLMKRR